MGIIIIILYLASEKPHAQEHTRPIGLGRKAHGGRISLPSATNGEAPKGEKSLRGKPEAGDWLWSRARGDAVREPRERQNISK